MSEQEKARKQHFEKELMKLKHKIDQTQKEQDGLVKLAEVRPVICYSQLVSFPPTGFISSRGLYATNFIKFQLPSSGFHPQTQKLKPPCKA